MRSNKFCYFFIRRIFFFCLIWLRWIRLGSAGLRLGSCVFFCLIWLRWASVGILRVAVWTFFLLSNETNVDHQQFKSICGRRCDKKFDFGAGNSAKTRSGGFRRRRKGFASGGGERTTANFAHFNKFFVTIERRIGAGIYWIRIRRVTSLFFKVFSTLFLGLFTLFLGLFNPFFRSFHSFFRPF